MRREHLERAGFWGLRLVTYLIVAVVGYILFDVIRHGLPVMSWEFVTGFPRRSGAEGGILPAIVGTLCLSAGTIAAALPLGIGAAVYLSEYARQGRFTRLVRLAVVTLAGVPSIVFGLFGLGLFVIFLDFGASILAGSLTLACMVLPTIVVASEEALQAVPKGLREASLALGATKWQTIRTNVLPYAVSGMITGSILAIGRAAGETAPILLTVAAFYLPQLPKSVFDQVMALPYHLYVLATQHPEAEKVLPMQYGTAFVLLVLVLGMSLGAVLLRLHYRKRYRW
ncbi:phosphate ABC transporter permease PstA [Dissulfurirhabdus thermomarina]|uniref:Phosphate transport system permease protein PstA n=1 Tax=Dissulfurirhabdus thermomarina TaxID=1765737 RepID=A0A6N9TRK1_DISTH|nr:phosphate ABC transporter permease PstA [Dissulfurirhabdus thermomarina]NDY42384.1 phosphate ABC transporter permease PstA [Dissulfurirhabdus thermomarina]NMX24314.1 phosphate ABC transporter permease PstA [Dissulfurirhabdus thermomarina]